VNGSGASRRRFFLVLAPLLVGSIAIPAGRSEAAESKPTAAQVAEGLKTLQTHVDEAAEYAAKDKATAQKHWDEAHETWEGIEDTIRDTHKDSYTAYENALKDLEAAVKEGDGTGAAGEAAAMANTTKNYLGVFTAQGEAKPAAAPAAGERTAAAVGESAPAGTLARTGNGASALTALAGAAFGLGGLSVIGGSRRRRR
jgi:hypothetical protein